MADSWEDEEFDLPSTTLPTTVPVSWEDEVRFLKPRSVFRYCRVRRLLAPPCLQRQENRGVAVVPLGDTPACERAVQSPPGW